jgi:prevent-host-death family protein
LTISAKELRGKPSQIIELAERGTEIIITLRGRKAARLTPYDAKSKDEPENEDEIFGLWKDREAAMDVGEYVRSLRKGRKF